MADELQNNGQQTLNDSGHDTEAIDVAGLRAALKKGGNKGIFNKGVCSTEASTAAKTVTVGSAFTLEEDALVLVRFANEVTSENTTLSVNNSTAKTIYYHGEALEPNVIKANSEYIMRYDGSYWCIIGGMADREIEVEIGETAPTGTPKLFVDEDADPEVSIDVYTRAQVDAMIADTVHVSAQTLTEAQKAQARDNIGVVGSGFQVTTDETTGTDVFVALGTATITHDDTTGADIFSF